MLIILYFFHLFLLIFSSMFHAGAIRHHAGDAAFAEREVIFFADTSLCWLRYAFA